MTTATKVRLRFGKRGDLRLVSHHDLMRCLERMLRRARVPMATSQGFNPRPKMTFALALGLGIEALREVVDLELTEPWTPPELLARLEACAPPGFDWVDAAAAAARRRRAAAPVGRLRAAGARGPPRGGPRGPVGVPVVRELAGGPPHGRIASGEIDLRPHVLSADLAGDGVLRFRLAVVPEGSARPEDLLEALGLGDLLEKAPSSPASTWSSTRDGRGPARPPRRPRQRRPPRIPTDYRPNTARRPPRRKSRKDDRMKKEMLINVLQPEECRIAIVEDGVLEELYVERTSHESYTGNIYKGKIVNIEPAIQAAFVDFSVGRNGFLHVSDVEPQYFHRHAGGEDEPEAPPRERGRATADRDRGRSASRDGIAGRGRG